MDFSEINLAISECRTMLTIVACCQPLPCVSKKNVDLYSTSRYKTFNGLVTLVTAEKNCFQELFKAIKTVRISEFIWQ